MNEKGSMKLKNVGESIMEVFEITGFSDFLTIEYTDNNRLKTIELLGSLQTCDSLFLRGSRSNLKICLNIFQGDFVR